MSNYLKKLEEIKKRANGSSESDGATEESSTNNQGSNNSSQSVLDRIKSKANGTYNPFSSNGKEGWSKFLADEDAERNAPQYDLNGDGQDAWWEKVIGYLGGSGGGVTDTSMPTAGVTQTINDLRADISYRRPNDDWSDEQRSQFGELYLSSPEKAFAFAEETNNKNNAEKEKAAIKEIQDSATDNLGAGIGHTLGAIATAPLGLADYLSDLAYANAGRDIAPDGQVSPFEYSQAVTGGITEHLNEEGGTLPDDWFLIGGKGWGDVYGLGTSIAQSMASAYTLGGAGTLVSYFGQGAAAGVDDALARGATDEQAIGYGAAVGTFEGVAEMIGIDNLFKLGSASTVKGVIKNILKQAGAEGTEEGFTSILNNIADNIIMQDKSQFNVMVAELMANGMSEKEAISAAWWESVEGIIFDTVAGSISGSVSGGIHTGVQNIADNYNAKKTYAGAEGDLVSEALEIDPNNATAQAMKGRLDAGKKLSGGQINRLVEANENALVSQDKTKMKSAVEARLTELGEEGDVSALAEVIVKKASGEKLSRSEMKTLNESENGDWVSDELSTDPIYKGFTEEFSNWAGSIGTERINVEAYNRGEGVAIEQAGTTPVAKNPTTAKAPTEAKLGAYTNAKVTIERDGEEVEVKPQKIASIEGDSMTIELDNGEVVDATEVDFGESQIGLVYQAAKDMSSRVGGFNIDTANVFVRGYNSESGITAAEYVHGFSDAYRFGKMGYPVSELASGVYTSKLTEANRKTAYNFGKAFGNDEVANKSAKIASTSANIPGKDSQKGSAKKKGKVHFEGRNVRTDLNDRQRASLDTLDVIAEAMGIDIRVFESPIVDGRRLGKNGSYNPETHEVEIDLHAGVNGNALMLFTGAHELSHHIKEVNPVGFKVFADALFEEYGKHDISVEDLIRDKLKDLKKNGRLKGKTEGQAYDLAYEEVVADACEAMLVDSNAIKALSKKIYAKDKGLWQTIKDFITNLVARVKAAYKGLNPDSREANLVREMVDSSKRLQKLWVEALLGASEVSIDQTLGESGIMVNSKTESASLMSVRDVLTDADRKKVSKALAERFNVTPEEATEWLKAETSLASLILNTKYSQYLDYTADPNEVAIKQNSDYPQGTVDFSPICAKRREFTAVMNNILRLFPNHVFAATDLAKIRTIMQEEGMTIPCGICYVEDRRQLDTIVAQNFIDSLKLYREGSKTRPDGKPFNTNQLNGLKLIDGNDYTPSIYELVSLEGLNLLKEKNPQMAEAWIKFNNARGMQSVRLLANEAEYKRQILKYNKNTVKSKNDKGGLRVYSFSDMEMFHLIDIIQVITDSATVGLSLQGYTKVNEYAKAVKDTGEKLNRSLIPKGDLGYHIEDGKVVLDYDTVEGIDINHPDFFDNMDNPNIGNITIGVSDVQIRAAMVSDFVDQIIPFHTGQSEEVLGEKGISTWDNYKDFQKEKDIATGTASDHQINIYTEVLQVLEKEGKPITKRTFVEKFLQVCKENNLTPRFSQFLNTNEHGEYTYTEGYHKFLVDFKTFDQRTGEYLPQMPVKPIFDNEYITKLLKDYVKSQKVKDAEIANSMPTVIDRITKEIVNPDGVKHSDRAFSEEFINSTLNSYGITKLGDYIHVQRQVFDTLLNEGFFTNTETRSRIDINAESGMIVETNKSGIFETFSLNNYGRLGKFKKIAKLATVRNLPDAIKFGHLVMDDAENIHDSADNNKKFAYIEYATEVDGKEIVLKLAIKKSPQKNKFWVHSIYTIENVSDSPASTDNGTEAGHITADNKGIIPQDSNSVNRKFSDRDSLGNELSKEQQEFFKDSKVRDAKGKLLVVYHGTDTDITVFDESYSQDGTSIFLTDSKYVASTYTTTGRIMPLYVNLVNPLLADAKGKDSFHIPIPKELEYMQLGKICEARQLAYYAKGMGYDGVIIKNVIDVAGFATPRKATDIIAFDALQIKSITNKNPSSDPDIRYSDRPSQKSSYAPTFYSHMGRVIDDVKLEKMGTSSILNHLKNRGVKDEEIKWSGIEAFLEGKKSVTKAELQEFVAGSQLQIEETIIDNTETPMTNERKDKIATLERERNNLVDKVKSEWKRIFGTDELSNYAGESLPYDFNLRLTTAIVDKKTATPIGQEYKAAQKAMREICEESDYFGYDDAKQAYVAVLRNPDDFLIEYELTATEEAAVKRLAKAKEAWLALQEVPAYDVQYLKDLGEDVNSIDYKINRVRAEHRAEQTLPRWGSYKLKGGDNYREIIFKMPDSDYTNAAMETHWSEFDLNGVLAHARIQDFNVNGKKMLFIEEIQSDWHNEGAKEGYADREVKARIDELKAKTDEAFLKVEDYSVAATGNAGEWEIIKRTPRGAKLIREYRDAKAELKKAEDDYIRLTPDAPFRTTYHEYVLKRLLRMAAEEGYDSIGWTTAETQDERWSDNQAHEEGKGKSGNLIGYTIEYDQDMPKFLRKYGRKWGATVGSSDLNGTEVWSMDITDSMKASVLYEGQVMYSERVTDKKTLDFLNKQLENGEVTEVYRAMTVDDDGNLYPPMAGYVRKNGKKIINGHPSVVGEWEQSTESIPWDSVDEEFLIRAGFKHFETPTKDYPNGRFERDNTIFYKNKKGEWKAKFHLDKDNGSTVDAAYAPYIHTSLSVLNDQFTSAYTRENLVVVKGYVPNSEVYGVDGKRYQANFADKPVGKTKWHSGVVAAQMPETRTVILSRYFMPIEIVDDSVVAMKTKEMMKGNDIEIPYNVVTPSQRRAMEAIGVRIGEARGLKDAPKKADVKYQDRPTESFSNRSLLANALESTAQNDIERDKLRLYKEKIDLINSEEQKLHELREKIKTLSFAKGARDTEAIKKLQFEANQAANRINTYDRQLLNLESTKALKGVLEREKAQARKRAEAKGKEALEKYKERAAKTQRELMERYQESRRKGVESRSKTALRKKIKDVVNELNQYLLNGTKEKHVPIGLQSAVAEALDAVNMDTVSAEERIAKKREEMRIAASKGRIEEVEKLVKEIDHIQEMGGNMEAKLSRLKTAYDSILNSDDPIIANSHDDVISSSIDKVIEVVGNTPLRDMSLYQLEAVYDLYRMVLHSVRSANKAFKAKKNEEISIIANRVIAEIDKIGKKSKLQTKTGDAVSKFDWNNQKPVYAFERIGSDTFTEVFNNVRAGEDTWATDMSEAQAFREEQYNKYKYNSWDFKKRYEFTSTTGKKFSLSLDQIMSLYAYAKRGDQAKDHLKYGGFVFDGLTEVKQKTKLGVTKTYQLKDATSYNISDNTLADIISKLTPEQRAFADAMQDYLSTVMGEKGNEVSLALYDVKLFKEKNYFPLKSAPQYLERAREQAQGDVKIKNKGFTKETTPKAKNPIVLTSFMDVWAGHVNEMSMYHAFTLALEDFYRVFNYKTPSTNENLPTEGVISFLENAHGGAAVSYIDQLLKDLNGGARSDPRETVAKSLMSSFKKAAVMGSLSVVVQQPTAIVRAMALVDAKHFGIAPISRGTIRAFNRKKHKALWAEVKKYAPVAIIKEMGYFDTGMGQSSVEWLKGEKRLMDKVDDALSKAPAVADELAWISIWEAVKRETLHNHKDLNPTSEEFLKLVGERFTEVVTKTQVYDSTLAKSSNMRSKSAFMNMWTAFMAEPTTSINMIADALRKGKGGNKKYTAKAFGAVLGSVALNAALVSLVYAMRDDDEDETFLEKYLSRVTTEFVDGINPVTYIPFLKDVWSIMQGFDIERADMSLISELVGAVQEVAETISKDTSDMTEEELSKHQKEVAEALWGIVDSIASLAGIPEKNIRRDTKGIINLFETLGRDMSTTHGSLMDTIGEDLHSSTPVWNWFDGDSKTDNLYDAIVSGDTAYVDRLKSAYKSESSYDSAIRKALRENDPRIKEAAEARYNGNIAEYMKIAKEIIREGNFKQDDVVAAINSEISDIKKRNGETTSSAPSDKVVSLYKIEDYYTAIVGGDDSTAYAVKYDLIETDVANGKSRDDAEASFDSKFMSHIRDLHEAGEVNDYKAREMLVDYGGKTADEAESKVQYWNFKKQYPDYDLSEDAVNKYYKDVQPSGISVGVYYDYSKQRSKAKGVDLNGDGKTDSGSVKSEVMQIINSLPISSYQKDALYYLNGWSKSTIYEAPWH